MEINSNDYYYELEHYTKNPNIEILYQLCDETPARVIDVIFREAVKTYENLIKDEEYLKSNFKTTTFSRIKIFLIRKMYFGNYIIKIHFMLY